MMKTFKATLVDDSTIELADPEGLAGLWEAIESSENFILSWKEGGVLRSQVMIGSNLIGKVKDEEIKLCSRGVK